MALFKPFRGTRATLDSQELHDGYAYFCTDDGSFHIDYVDENGNLQRKQINAEEAEKLTGYDIATVLNASDAEIPTSGAVYDAIKNLADTAVGESLEGQTLTLSDGSTVTASEGAEIFNDYRMPTYNSYSFMSAGNIASGAYSHAEGSGNLASGDKSHAEGIQVVASGEGSHAEGYRAKATGLYSHAEGVETVASGIYSHAEGQKTQATASNAHAEGQNTIASGRDSHAEGGRDTQIRDANGNVMSTTSSGYASHAEGVGTLAGGSASHAEGRGTIATSKNQHAQGKFNIEDAEEKYAHITGNGSSTSKRSNAHTLDWSGNAWFAGNVYIGGTGQDDASAKKLITDADIQQSDWDQTDETATDYVKNRPCGRYAAKEVYSGTVTGFTSLSYATTPTWSAIVPTGVGIPEYGQVYDVTIDGITYRGATVQETTFAEPAIGTTEVYYYPNEQHPYTIIFRENEFEVHVQTEGDSHTIEFNRVDSIKKLSMEFLPNELITEGELKKVRSNWAQNDSTALDYIHNRTHYDAEVSDVIADEQEVTYTYDSSLNYSTPTSHGKVTTVSDTRLVVDNTYVVTIDGVEYVATAQSGSDSMAGKCPFLFVDCGGVLGYFINELRDNESYGCIAVEVYNQIQRTNVTTTFTIKIEEKTTTAVPLPERFIPDTIARTSDINTQMEEVNNHIADTANPHNVTAEQVGIYIGPNAPTNPNIKVWINTTEEGTGVIPLLPRVTTITLVEANWVGNSAPYSQVVEIPTATAVSKIDLQPTVSQIIELQNADIAFMAENLDGVITVYSFGGKPSANMTMQVMLTEVSYV